MYSNFIHVAACIRISFFFEAEELSIVSSTFCLFIPLLLNTGLVLLFDYCAYYYYEHEFTNACIRHVLYICNESNLPKVQKQELVGLDLNLGLLMPGPGLL